MPRKSLKIFVRILLLGLLLGTSSTAYADTLSITSISFSNFQITASSSGENTAPEIPAPATMILLVSRLGFMGGFMKKRRNRL